MISITNNESAARARYEIERVLLAAGRWEIRENGEPVGSVDRERMSLTVEWGKLVFAWWDDERSRSWRVAAYESDEAELRLQVTRGMGRRMERVSLRDPLRWRERELAGAPAEARRRFERLLQELLGREVPGAKLVRSTIGADRVRSVAGGYARLVLRRARETMLAIGVSASATPAEIDGVIAAGLVWLAAYNGGRDEEARARRLWICLPAAHSQTARERLAWLDAAPWGAAIECFEVDERRETLTSVRPVVQTELLHAYPRDVVWPREARRSDIWRGRILALAPGLIESRRRPHREGEGFALHGLEFAHVGGGAAPRTMFGVAGAGDRRAGPVFLTEENFFELEGLAREILRYRRADSPDRRHPFYRLRTEAWLESLLRRDIRALDAALDDRFVYSQIPTWRGEERSVIDLLTVKYEGARARLVIIEIKAAEDRELPLQGLDYWLRVEQARLRGEFARRGLFPGLELADRPPLLYLVAPRLRFHRSFALVASALSSRIDAYRVGINANWREGVKVHALERINVGELQTMEEAD